MLLELDQLQKANEAGTDGLLREATIGRLFGFNIVVDPNLTADEGLAYNRRRLRARHPAVARSARVPPRPPRCLRTASRCGGSSTTTRCSSRTRASSTPSWAPRFSSATRADQGSPPRPDRS